MQVIPFTGGIREYRFTTTLDELLYEFRVTWNARDQAWYFDVADADGQPIMYGVKVVLGTNLGRTYKHPLVKNGAMFAVDRSGKDVDAGFLDFGSRVVVLHLTGAEMAAAVIAGMAG